MVKGGGVESSTGGSEELSAEILTSAHALRAHREQWDSVFSHFGRANPFVSWEWHYCWWQTFAADRELAVVVLRAGPEPVAIAPLFIQKERLRGVLTLRTIRFSSSEGGVGADYLDLLIVPGYEERAIARLLKVLYEELTWDVMHLAPISEHSPSVELIGRASERLGLPLMEPAGVLCPFLTLPDNWDDYLSQLSKSRRKELRRKLRRFHTAFEVELESVHDPADLEPALETLTRLNRLRLRQKGKAGGFLNDDFSTFHRRLIPQLMAKGQARIFLLKANGVAIAANYLFAHDSTWYQYQGGFDPSYASYGVGTVLDAVMIRHAIEQEDVQVYDFLRGDEDYKLGFGGQLHGTHEIVLFNHTWRSLLALAIHRTTAHVRDLKAAHQERQRELAVDDAN